MKSISGLVQKAMYVRMWPACLAVLLIALSCMWSSCEGEGDDVGLIFNDKRLKITGCVYNGVGLGGEGVKEFYASPNTYYIEFLSGGAFKCVLTEGSDVTGAWSADGDGRKLAFDVRNAQGTGKTVLSRQVFDILKSARRYSGDSNVMKIYKDSGNYIILNADGI